MLKGSLGRGTYERCFKVDVTLLPSPFRIPTENSPLFWGSCSKPSLYHYTPDSAMGNRIFFSWRGEFCVSVVKNNAECGIPSYTGWQIHYSLLGISAPCGPGSCMNKLPAALGLPALWRWHFRALLQADSEESALAGLSQQWQVTRELLHRSFRWKNLLFLFLERA